MPSRRRTKDEIARARVAQLFTGDAPRWVRVYDDEGSADRYTVVFTGKYRTRGLARGERSSCDFQYLGMSGAPFHPQGIAQHGEHREPIDAQGGKWPPARGEGKAMPKIKQLRKQHARERAKALKPLADAPELGRLLGSKRAAQLRRHARELRRQGRPKG